MEAGTYVLAMTVEGSGKMAIYERIYDLKRGSKTFNEKDVTVKKRNLNLFIS